MEDLFKLEEPIKTKMNKDEYLKKTQQFFDIISNVYSKSFYSKSLEDNEYPTESICDSCNGCGKFKINDEIKECFQDKEYGECFHRCIDYEELGQELVENLNELHDLLGIDELVD